VCNISLLMPHITKKDMAKAIFGTFTEKERSQIREKLITKGTAVAIDLLCSKLETSTGLSEELCRPVAKQIAKNIRIAIRKKMSQ